MCQRAYRISFGRAVEQITFEPAGVDTVDVLGRRTQRAGQSQPRSDDACNLHRCRSHQPDLLPYVEVHLSECPGPGPDAPGDRLFVNLGCDLGQLRDGVPFDEAQCHAADILDVAGLLSSHHAEVRLYPEALQDHSWREEAAPIQTLGKLEERGA